MTRPQDASGAKKTTRRILEEAWAQYRAAAYGPGKIGRGWVPGRHASLFGWFVQLESGQRWWLGQDRNAAFDRIGCECCEP